MLDCISGGVAIYVGPVSLVVPAWLQVGEHLVVDVAAVATVIAVLLTWKALRESNETTRTLNESLAIARDEQEREHRQRAALILPRIDLLQLRLNSNWRDSLAYEESYPSREVIESWFREAGQDVGFANDLLERASHVDPELAIYAELVWQRIKAIEFALAQALQNAGMDREKLGEEMRKKLEGQWRGHRMRILQKAAEAAELLRRMETCLPKHATTVQGMSREKFSENVGRELEPIGKKKTEDMLNELRGEKSFITTSF